MPQATSKDGTTIAYDRLGQGPALILVAGAFQDRRAMASYAEALKGHFTVFNYDRRGRGDSSDTQPYAIEREIEDIDALIKAAGDEVFMFGGSSGGVLALDAVAHGLEVSKLAVYEPPFVVDDTRPPVPADILDQFKTMIADGRSGDAAELFLTKGSLMPSEAVAGMRSQPFWAEIEGAANTILYDGAIMDGLMLGQPLPTERWSKVTTPTLVLYGQDGPSWSRNAAQALVKLLPQAKEQALPGGFHELSADTLAPALTTFFLE